MDSIFRRLAILWAAIKHLFTGKGLYLMQGTSIVVGDTPGFSAHTWIQDTNLGTSWEHWAMVMTRDNLDGYVNGQKIPPKTTHQEAVSSDVLIEQAPNGVSDDERNKAQPEL